MLALTPAVLQLIQLGLTVAPEIAAEIAAAAQTEVALFTSGTAPTPAQQAQIDAALDVAHAALQAAVPASA
jgi:hypothetical protein